MMGVNNFKNIIKTGTQIQVTSISTTKKVTLWKKNIYTCVHKHTQPKESNIQSNYDYSFQTPTIHTHTKMNIKQRTHNKDKPADLRKQSNTHFRIINMWYHTYIYYIN